MAKINITKPQNNLTVTALDGSKKILSTTPIGIQGPKGDTGPNGEFGGPKGDTGATGVSISGASLSNYNLILTFSNGSTVNVGYVRGETGPTGLGGAGGCGGSLETLNPSPAGYYPYASLFIDQYGRVTGASGATDIASQSSLIQLYTEVVEIESSLVLLAALLNGVVGGTW